MKPIDTFTTMERAHTRLFACRNRAGRAILDSTRTFFHAIADDLEALMNVVREVEEERNVLKQKLADERQAWLAEKRSLELRLECYMGLYLDVGDLMDELRGRLVSDTKGDGRE